MRISLTPRGDKRLEFILGKPHLKGTHRAQGTGAATVTPDSIRMAATMVATLPIIMVYPFIQKYFVKGIMLGAVKG